ncbi:hypothetical protein A0256_21550 [Mucilaginibacter sp. PAMC 26640]|nr:hypothetical protein A0256_21550 [Mucilaginibacter sp. PAMC 26640]
MSHTFLMSFLSLLLFNGINTTATKSTTAADEQICGKWQTEEKNLVVQVYKENSQFKAKIIWFNDKDDSKPMDYWTDKNNPDPALRSRKLIGLNVLENLVYDASTNSWEEGMIYDAKNGRHWNSSAYIDKNGLLKVKGYWHFKFIGKTMTFNRI